MSKLSFHFFSAFCFSVPILRCHMAHIQQPFVLFSSVICAQTFLETTQCNLFKNTDEKDVFGKAQFLCGQSLIVSVLLVFGAS